MAGAPAKPRANDYRQKGRNVYHVDGGPPPEGGRRGGRGGRGRGRGRERNGGQQPGGRAGVGGPSPFCDLHGEGSHTTSECRTIAAMWDYMNRDQQPAERENRAGASNQLPTLPQRPRIEGGYGERQQRIINMIAGGSSLGMPSKRQCHTYAR